MDTAGCFPVDKAAEAWNWPTHLHLVPRSGMVELYLHSPIRPHSVVRNQLS
jgi:hypothetical protein